MRGIPLAHAPTHLNKASLITAYFGVGLLGQLLSYTFMLLSGSDYLIGATGPGLTLATIHSFTGLTLLPITMGASIQILPVLSSSKPLSHRICWIVLLLLVIGQGAMIVGMLNAYSLLMALGAAMSGLSVMLFAFLTASVLSTASFKGFPEVQQGVALALLSLVTGVLLGASLGVNFANGWLPDAETVAIQHATLMVFGYAGSLVIGYSPFFMQMVTMTTAIKPRVTVLLLLHFTLVFLVVIGLGLNLEFLVGTAMAMAAILAIYHAFQMEMMIAKQMSRTAGGNILLFRLSWYMLPLGLITGALGYLEVLPNLSERWVPIFATTILYGWLLSIILGVIVRIIPLLSAMYILKECGTPVSMTKLEPVKLFRVMVPVHYLVVILMFSAVIFESDLLLIFGSLAGITVSGLLLSYAGIILVRAKRFIALNL